MSDENKKTKNDKFVGSVKVGPKGQIVRSKRNVKYQYGGYFGLISGRKTRYRCSKI